MRSKDGDIIVRHEGVRIGKILSCPDSRSTSRWSLAWDERMNALDGELGYRMYLNK
jgi:hypothetical protein